jgi:SAM-dependent methyltransferase
VAYDRQLVPWLFEQWAEPIVDRIAPEPSSRVVDIACGSGLIVRHLVGRLGASGRVYGVDVDAAMLTYAASTVDDGRVSWHQSDATRLPLPTAGVDRVSCHHGLQFFPDRLAALAEMRRVLVPGGRIAVATWGRLEANPWPTALAGAVTRLLGDEAGAGMAVVCDLGDPVELDSLLRGAGFEEVVVDAQERTVTHPDVQVAVAGQLAALPSGSRIGQLDGEQRTEMIALMCELLADHTDATGRLHVPSGSNLASGVNR